MLSLCNSQGCMLRFRILFLLLLCFSNWAYASTPVEVSKYNASSADEGYSKAESDNTSECPDLDCGLQYATREPRQEDATLSPTSNETEFDGNDDDEFEIYYHRWGGIDILVAVFFVVAAGWLLMAILYSAVVLVLLRLQARGELDFYDENFGLWVCCNGRIRIHFGCILRRYAIQLEREQQQRRPADGDDPSASRRVRIMTRAERRFAMERILNATTSPSAHTTKAKQEGLCPMATVRSDVESDSSEAPVCTVCLCEYEPGDQIFAPTTCSHMFHKECIMDWLERRQNTDCPCCREPIVDDDDVWGIVKAMRKARRKALQRENGIVHRTINWILGNKRKGDNDDEDDHNNSRLPDNIDADLPLPNEPMESIVGSTDIESGSASDDNDVNSSYRLAQIPNNDSDSEDPPGTKNPPEALANNDDVGLVDNECHETPTISSESNHENSAKDKGQESENSKGAKDQNTITLENDMLDSEDQVGASDTAKVGDEMSETVQLENQEEFEPDCVDDKEATTSSSEEPSGRTTESVEVDADGRDRDASDNQDTDKSSESQVMDIISEV